MPTAAYQGACETLRGGAEQGRRSTSGDSPARMVNAENEPMCMFAGRFACELAIEPPAQECDEHVRDDARAGQQATEL